MGKRSCRRTDDENRIHEKAVKMRKMTDEQLVRYVEDRVQKARSEGFHEGERKAGRTQSEANKNYLKSAKKYLEDLKKAQIPGIGAVTYSKLMKVAQDNGYMQ